LGFDRATIFAGMSVDRSPHLARRKPEGRSRVSNGTTLFAERIDGRSLWARRFRDLLESHVMDMGGPAACSEAQCSLIRRVATLEVELERMEGQFAQQPAEADQLDLYQRMSNTLRRLVAALGLERRSKRWVG
jgi:hypothetical protein